MYKTNSNKTSIGALLIFLYIGLISISPYAKIQIAPTFVLYSVAFISYIWINKNRAFKYSNYKPVYFWLIWLTISSIRGVFMVDDYWGYKALTTNMINSFLPCIIYLFCVPKYVHDFYNYWCKYWWIPTLIFLIPFCPQGEWTTFFSPLLLFIPFISVFKRIDRILIILMILLFMLNWGVRSSILRVGIFLIIGLFLLHNHSVKFNNYRLYSAILIGLPIALFMSAVYLNFNIFEFDKYLDFDYTFQSHTGEGDTKDESILDDTRTFIYQEATLSSIKNDYWLIGRSLGRGYDSDFFGELIGEMIGKAKAERVSCEVAIVDVFTHTGLIGVIIYTYMFCVGVFRAITRGKNKYIKVCAVCVSVMYFMSWIENAQTFNYLNIVIFTMLAICYSQAFQSMNNNEFESFLKSTFSRPKIGK